MSSGSSRRRLRSRARAGSTGLLLRRAGGQQLTVGRQRGLAVGGLVAGQLDDAPPGVAAGGSQTVALADARQRLAAGPHPGRFDGGGGAQLLETNPIGGAAGPEGVDQRQRFLAALGQGQGLDPQQLPRSDRGARSAPRRGRRGRRAVMPTESRLRVRWNSSSTLRNESQSRAPLGWRKSSTTSSCEARIGRCTSSRRATVRCSCRVAAVQRHLPGGCSSWRDWSRSNRSRRARATSSRTLSRSPSWLATAAARRAAVGRSGEPGRLSSSRASVAAAAGSRSSAAWQSASPNSRQSSKRPSASAAAWRSAAPRSNSRSASASRPRTRRASRAAVGSPAVSGSRSRRATGRVASAGRLRLPRTRVPVAGQSRLLRHRRCRWRRRGRGCGTVGCGAGRLGEDQQQQRAEGQGRARARKRPGSRRLHLQPQARIDAEASGAAG